METRPGKEEKLVAQPQLRIMAGQTGSLCYPVAGKSFSATSSGEPQGMIGEQEVDVCVTPTGHNDRVLLDVTFQQVEQDSKAAKYYVERMSGVRMCKQVKLGKTVKLPCDLPSTGEKVHCRIEATIKKASASRDVSVAAPSMPPCSEPCPCPKPMDAPVCGPIAPVDCCIPVMPRCIEPAKKAPSPKLRLCVGHWADGKGVLEMRGSGAGLVLTDKTVVNLKGCVPLKIAIVDGQISLTGEQCSLKAKADHVSITPHGCLLLEGHVHVEGAGDDEVIEIQGGKVRLKLPRPCQTGVISSPTLIQ
ncbi:MAG: hypothetical protein HYS12_13225 [Planctomycetes bacterium]|nr:hypothetical protein [Planctomycetota bacterium]